MKLIVGTIYCALVEKYGEDYVEYNEKENCFYVNDEDTNTGFRISVDITT